VWDDGGPSSHRLTAQHLTGLLEKAGVSWKAYQEDISGTNCPLDPVNGYFPKHNPALILHRHQTAASTTTRRVHLAHPAYAELAHDLEAGTVPQYSFITPNICNDMHDNSGCQTRTRSKNGDTWLAQAVPQILGPARTGTAARCSSPGTRARAGRADRLHRALADGQAGYVNSVAYNHSSTLAVGAGDLRGDADARRGRDRDRPERLVQSLSLTGR